MYPTFKELILEVLTEAGLVVGMAVQQYTEPQVRLAIQRMFDFLLKKKAWEHLSSWRTAQLDGVTGVVTGNFTQIKAFEDIHVIRRFEDDTPIIRSLSSEHLYAEGTQALFWTPIPYGDADFATKRVRFWPKTATGKVLVHALNRPDAFLEDSDIVPFDKTVMALGAAWYLVQADGMNVANAEKLQGMFDVAYNDYVTSLNTLDIGHGRGRNNGSTFTVGA